VRLDEPLALAAQDVAAQAGLRADDAVLDVLEVLDDPEAGFDGAGSLDQVVDRAVGQEGVRREDDERG